MYINRIFEKIPCYFNRNKVTVFLTEFLIFFSCYFNQTKIESLLFVIILLVLANFFFELDINNLNIIILFKKFEYVIQNDK